MPNKGVYIALEGLDGSGKSTLYKNLIEIFKNENISFDTLCPTQISNPNSLAERIYHSNEKIKRINLFRILIESIKYFV